MPRLLLRGADLGEIEAVLFDKDGTLSHSEPDLLTLAQVAVTEKYRQYEELARKNGGQFHSDAPYIPPFSP